MQNVVLIIHLLLALSLIGVVLLQRSEGGGLGIGGGDMGPQAGRPPLTGLAKLTWGFAIAFIGTSLALTVIGASSSSDRSILERIGAPVPATAPATQQGPAQGPAQSTPNLQLPDVQLPPVDNGATAPAPAPATAPATAPASPALPVLPAAPASTAPTTPAPSTAPSTAPASSQAPAASQATGGGATPVLPPAGN